jgi:hypothetical protein
MSRRPINWDKAKREDKGRASRDLLAVEDLQGIYIQQLADGQKLKPILKERVRLSEAAVRPETRQSALKLVSGSKVLLVDKTIKKNGTPCCLCNLEFAYHYPDSLDIAEFLCDVLQAILQVDGSRGLLSFNLECPST